MRALPPNASCRVDFVRRSDALTNAFRFGRGAWTNGAVSTLGEPRPGVRACGHAIFAGVDGGLENPLLTSARPPRPCARAWATSVTVLAAVGADRSWSFFDTVSPPPRMGRSAAGNGRRAGCGDSVTVLLGGAELVIHLAPRADSDLDSIHPLAGRSVVTCPRG